jgi:glutamine amidotransferase-like uncharacterized protein
VGVPLVIALNFRRTSAAIGLRLGELFGAIRVPVMAGTFMYGSVAGARVALDDLADYGRLPLLVVVGACVYVAAITVLDRNLWVRLRDIASMLRHA